MSHDGNGSNGGQGAHINQLILTFNSEIMAVEVGGHTQNLDIALAMLDMARRALEARQRAAEVAVSLARPMPGNFDLRGRR